MLRLCAASLATLFALIAGEVAVRLIGTTDADGNFHFRGRIVGPRRPPVEWVREIIEQYRTSDDSRMIYDPQTGWSPRPGFSETSGRYRYNSQGIRSAPTVYREQPEPGTLRIALLGDSFTHGDDVFFEQTWGYLLQQTLRGKKLSGRELRGGNIEVINFGVSAFGMDQAFLHWRKLGRRYHPHVVIFGFQAENVARNANILRGFYVTYTGIPFSKPRFVLDRAGRLRPVNLPAMPIERVPEVMKNMEAWEHARHEWFYDPDAYARRRFWHHSRLALVVADVLGDSEENGDGDGVRRDVFAPQGEPVRVTRALLRRFREDVEQSGARFLVVHLPKKSDLARVQAGRALRYDRLLEAVQREHATIDPQPALLEAAGAGTLDELYIPRKRHYSEKGNRLISEVVAEYIERTAAAKPETE